MNPLRLILGAAGALGLALAAGWAAGPGEVRANGVVEPALEYRVEHAGEGLVRWRLLDGTVPGGPAVLSEGLALADRSAPIEILLLHDKAEGESVAAGTPLARVRAPVLEAAATARTEDQVAAAADVDAIRAGARQGQAVAAQAQVELARANLARARRTAELNRALVSQGGGAAWEAELADLEVQVQERALKAAQAAVAGARDLPWEAEIDAAEARRRAAGAAADEARQRAQGALLTAPFDGTLHRPGGDVLLSLQGPGPTLVQVAVDARDRGDMQVGAALRFQPMTGGAPIPGTLVALSDRSTPRTVGGPVIWVLARLDSALPVGATGVAHIARGAP